MTDKAISPLRQRMIEDMEVRGFIACTQRGYISAVRDFTVFFGCPFNLSHSASQRDPGSASPISFCLPTGPRIPLEVDHGQAFTILFRPNTVQGHADAASVHIGAKRLCSKHGRWSGRETLVPVM